MQIRISLVSRGSHKAKRHVSNQNPFYFRISSFSEIISYLAMVLWMIIEVLNPDICEIAADEEIEAGKTKTKRRGFLKLSILPSFSSSSDKQ